MFIVFINDTDTATDALAGEIDDTVGGSYSVTEFETKMLYMVNRARVPLRTFENAAMARKIAESYNTHLKKLEDQHEKDLANGLRFFHLTKGH